ncbi:hypothetical protein GCM10007884_32780 [Methylobacterium brachythecii]|uniref:Uncharacterized protein n=1 Tax=Methylobacterium brachythecii TaxID=1176177 RepID=A0ABQ6D5S7_9HYPH|nr:hypothetical protein GCM10007884_32780 [Methylobacterium brachythecii]
MLNTNGTAWASGSSTAKGSSKPEGGGAGRSIIDAVCCARAILSTEPRHRVSRATLNVVFTKPPLYEKNYRVMSGLEEPQEAV